MTVFVNDYTNFIKYCNNEISEYQSNNIELIKYSAFSYNDHITKLSFPKVTEVRTNAFGHMSNLDQISLPKLTSIGQFAFAQTKLTTISLPSIINMGSYGFHSSSYLTSISAPNCTSVEWNCFQHCSSLSQVDFLQNLTYIDEYSFDECTSLTTLPLQNVVTLKSCAFRNCTGVTKIWLSSTCTTIESKTYQDVLDVTWAPFYGCNSNCVIYTDATSPKINWSKYWNYYDNTHKLDVCWGATYEDYLNDTYKSKSTLENFIDGSIREIIYPDEIALKSDAFYGCAYLFNIEFPQVTSVPNGCCWDCTSLKGDFSTMFPNATELGSVCFTDCYGFTSADLSNVTNVIDNPFQGCTGIRKLWVPSTCTTIGDRLFSNCWSTTIYTDASERLPGWVENWNSLNWDDTTLATVVWNATYEQFLQA